jgi:hypothetical protein
MLRLVAKSVAQAVAIVLGAEVCWSLVSVFVQNHPSDYGPLLVLVVYPLPIALAAWRKHNAALDIVITNLWLGWTIVGWFVALVWACNLNVEPEPDYESASSL